MGSLIILKGFESRTANSRKMAKCWLNFICACASLSVCGEDLGVKISQALKVVFVTKLTMHVLI